MAKPGVCPITSTYNLTYEGEEVVIDAQSGIAGRIACPAGNDIFHFSPRLGMCRRLLDEAPGSRKCC